MTLNSSRGFSPSLQPVSKPQSMVCGGRLLHAKFDAFAGNRGRLLHAKFDAFAGNRREAGTVLSGALLLQCSGTCHYDNRMPPLLPHCSAISFKLRQTAISIAEPTMLG